MILTDLPSYPAELPLGLSTTEGRDSMWKAVIFLARGHPSVRFVNVRRQNVAMALRPEELRRITRRRGEWHLESDAATDVIGRWMLGTHFFDPREEGELGQDLLLPSEAPKPLDERPRRPPNF